MVQAEVADRLVAGAGLQDVRRAVGQGRLVRRRAAGRRGRAHRVLAGAATSTRGLVAFTRREPPPGDRAGDVRGRRRRLRPAAQDPARRARRLGRLAGRGRAAAARRRDRPAARAASSSTWATSPGSPRPPARRLDACPPVRPHREESPLPARSRRTTAWSSGCRRRSTCTSTVGPLARRRLPRADDRLPRRRRSYDELTRHAARRADRRRCSGEGAGDVPTDGATWPSGRCWLLAEHTGAAPACALQHRQGDPGRRRLRRRLCRRRRGPGRLRRAVGHRAVPRASSPTLGAPARQRRARSPCTAAPRSAPAAASSSRPVLGHGSYAWVLALADGGLSTPDGLRRARPRCARRGPADRRGRPGRQLAALRSGDPVALGAALPNDLQDAGARAAPRACARCCTPAASSARSAASCPAAARRSRLLARDTGARDRRSPRR